MIRLLTVFTIVSLTALNGFSQTKTGDYDVNITAKDTLETETEFVYQDSVIEVLDLTYHEFSVDSVVWTKDHTGANWVRFSNKHKTDWWVLPISVFTQYWTVSGDTLTPSVNILVGLDSLYSATINAQTYYVDGDTLSITNIYPGDGSDTYVLTFEGDSAVWKPLGTGYGETNIMNNAGLRGVGVYDSKVDTMFNMRNIASLDPILIVTLDAADSVIDLDLALKTITAGVGLTGAGNMENDITIDLNIPVGLPPFVSIVDMDDDYIILYDASTGIHYKIHPEEMLPDIYVDNILDKTDAWYTNYKGSDNITIVGDGAGALQFTSTHVDLYVDSTVAEANADQINLVAGYGVTLTDLTGGGVEIAATAGGLPTCAEGQILMYLSGVWTCVNLCDYICPDTIISIITNYEDTVSTVKPDGNVQIVFDRSDCLDSVQIIADDFVNNTNNLTDIKIVTVPDVGELHYGGRTLINGDILDVTQGDLDSTLYYIASENTGSAYIDLFTFQLLFSSNNDYLSEFQVDVSVDACVTEGICYGYLYNWYAASDSRDLANTGWSVPTKTNFETLYSYLSDTPANVLKLKKGGLTFWNTPNEGATDEYGFGAKGSGQRTTSFQNFHSSTWIGTDTEQTADLCYHFQINYVEAPTIIGSGYKFWGREYRLVKDVTSLSHGEVGTYVGNDGKEYSTVCIGTQEWMAEPLEETEYRNGDAIPNVEDATTWSNLTTGALCLYDNDANNACKTPLPNSLPTSGHITAVSYSTGNVYTSSDLGDNWTITTLGDCYEVSLDSIGEYQLAAGYEDSVFISDNYGVTWDGNLSPTDKHEGTAISNNGEYQLVSVYGGYVYVSNNYGSTWTQKESSRNYRGAAMSASGEIQAISVYGGYIYISDDYGATWTQKGSSLNYQKIAMSSDGKYLTATVNNGQIYTSNDYGENWTARDSNRQWWGIDINKSGQIQIASVNGGYLYVSFDYGITWSQTAVSDTWRGVAINDIGNIMAASVYGTINTVQISTDFSNSWTVKSTGEYLMDVDVSK
ncbi:hypothetical protein [uncultured Mediterranean phage]|nr:hypothetical protein [uncultured Mediterranean phage]